MSCNKNQPRAFVEIPRTITCIANFSALFHFRLRTVRDFYLLIKLLLT